MIAISWDENTVKLLEILQSDNGQLTSYFAKNKIAIPENVEYVYLRSKVRTTHYTYEYSFDGKEWKATNIILDAKILSDDYVNMHYGGFFTGAFVGMANIDYSGYGLKSYIDYFKYQELN